MKAPEKIALRLEIVPSVKASKQIYLKQKTQHNFFGTFILFNFRFSIIIPSPGRVFIQLNIQTNVFAVAVTEISFLVTEFSFGSHPFQVTEHSVTVTELFFLCARTHTHTYDRTRKGSRRAATRT